MAEEVTAQQPFKIQQPGEEENALVERYREEAGALPGRLSSVRNEMETVRGEMDDIGAAVPQPPKFQPITEYQPRQKDPGDAMMFAGIAMALSAIGSKAAGGDISLMMNTAGSALDGYHRGDLQRTKTDIEQFNTQMRSVQAKNEQMLQEYQAVLANNKLTLQQKLQQYNILAKKWQDEIAESAIKKGDIRFELDRLDKIRDANNRLGMQGEALSKRMEAMIQAAQIRAQGVRDRQGAMNLSDESLNNMAAYYILNGRLPIGMSRMGQDAQQAVINRASEMAAKADMTPEDLAAAGPVTKQKLGALMALEKQRNAIQAYEGMLDQNMEILKDLSKDVTRSGSPYLNRPILWLKQNAAGDPKVAEYLFQVQTVATETARILNNPNLSGQLTDSARKELRDIIDGSLTPEQLEAVLNRAQSDVRNRSKSLDSQVDKVIKEIRDPMHRSVGESRAIQGEAERAWGAFEPNKYEYRMMNGKIQRKPKGG